MERAFTRYTAAKPINDFFSDENVESMDILGLCCFLGGWVIEVNGLEGLSHCLYTPQTV